jgi:hypothetical protein
MEPEYSLPCSQKLTTCPCPEPDQSFSCPQHPSHFFEDPFQYYPTIYALVFKVVMAHFTRSLAEKKTNVCRTFFEWTLLNWQLELQRWEADVKSEHYVLIGRNGNRWQWLTCMSNSSLRIKCHDTSGLGRPRLCRYFKLFSIPLHSRQLKFPIQLLQGSRWVIEIRKTVTSILWLSFVNMKPFKSGWTSQHAVTLNPWNFISYMIIFQI